MRLVWLSRVCLQRWQSASIFRIGQSARGMESGQDPLLSEEIEDLMESLIDR
jgi:hypothetical protein